MGYIYDIEEYNNLRKKILKELDSFLKNYDEFLRSTSTDSWRSSGYVELEKIRDKIKDMEHLDPDKLNTRWIRDQVLTPEQQEEWENSKKFNL